MARLVALTALGLACGEATPAPVAPGPPVDPALLYRDLTPESGLPSTGGPGVTLADLDGDGDDDLVLPTPEALRLYYNRGDAPVEPGPAVAFSEGAQSVWAADVTGDGSLDLLAVDPRELRLFVGPDWARSTQLPELPIDGEYSAVTFGDFSLGGRLDLLAIRLHAAGGEAAMTSVLVERTADTPLAREVLDPLHARVAATLDLNDDGRLDVWVGQEGFAPSRAYLGDGGGGFVESSKTLGLDLAASAMGFDAGDIDGDGDLDLVVANLFPALQLFVRDGERFVESATARGLTGLDGGSTWGLGLVDADNDGDLDLLAASGFGQGEVEGDTGLERLYFENDGGLFTRRFGAADTALDVSSTARGAAFSDLDGDGDVDAVITSVDAAPQVLRNELGTDARRWLKIQLRYPWHRPAVGARVRLTAGGRTLTRWVVGTPSYGGSSSECVHFGLGAAAEYTDLEVRWPNGVTQRESAGPANRTVVVGYR